MTQKLFGKDLELRKTAHQKKRFIERHMILFGGLLLMLGLWAALALRFPNDTGVLEVGVPSPIDVRARHQAEFVSEVKTEAARTQAEASPENIIYTVDKELPSEQRARLDELLTTISTIHNDPTLSDEEELYKLIELSSATGVLSGTLANTMTGLSTEEWENVRRQTLSIYDRAMYSYSYEISEEALRELRERNLPYWIRITQLSQPQRDLVYSFVSSFLRVNRTIDKEATEQRKQQAHQAVDPVWVTVQEGESIVRTGETVTQEDIEKARETGALPRRLNWLAIVGMGGLCALLSFTFMLYLASLQKEVARQHRPLIVIIVALIVTAAAARIMQPIWPDQPYAFPLATTILVLAVLFNLPIALAASILLSIVVGVMDSNNLALTVTLFVSSATAIFAVRGAERSLTFLLAGLGVAAVTVLSQFSFCLVKNGVVCWNDVPTILLFSGTNGGLSAILSLGLFNIVGNIAGVVTPLKLMELSHPAQPILRKIIHEAPGTYYHSIAVANLSEAAADAIGADALLLRVAAYYHDVGKTLRPFFFTDNQTGRENVHNELDPHISAEIIIDHVREGVKIARNANLPEQIIDFISTHHGTSLVGHFYQLALRQQDSVKIEDFRYPGPPPWTREQGILMLADSVEATVRAKVQHGKLAPSTDTHGNGQASAGMQTIEQLVNSIIDDRVSSGQLDNTSLTLRDLIRIRQAFITSLKSIYHPRTEYAPRLVKASS